MQTAIFKARGLQTFRNYLTTKEGAFLVADNCIINRDDIVEKRRGMKIYSQPIGSVNDRSKQLLQYKDLNLVHQDDQLFYDSITIPGTFTPYAGIYQELEAGLRIKYQEVNGNLYFTTSDGIKKISAADKAGIAGATPIDAGAPKALDLTATPNYSIPGFLNPNSATAYRVVWGYYDANNNLILGAPGSFTVVRNISTTDSCVVDLTFYIPQGITANYFYQIYRAAQVTPASSTPLDDLNLVIQEFVTSAQLTAGVVSTQDITPEDFRNSGTPLYTSAVSGESVPGLGAGIALANEVPPIAKDIALFKGSTFYSNTKTRHRLTVNLLSLSNFVSGTSSITISNGITTNTYIFRGQEEIAEVDFTSYSGAIPGGLLGRYFFMWSASNYRQYFVWFDTTGTDPVPVNVEIEGKLAIKVDVSAAVTVNDIATATASAINATADFDAISAAGLVTITNAFNGNATDTTDSANNPVAQGVTFTVTQQGLGEDAALKYVLLSNQTSLGLQLQETSLSLVNVINQQMGESVYAYYISATDDVPGQILFENRDINDIPFYIAVNDASISNNFNPPLPVVTAYTTTVGNPTIINSTAHGLTTGETVFFSTYNGTPSIIGNWPVTVINANTFSIPVDTTSGISGSGNYWKSNTVVSSNEVNGNRIYFSKLNQPEAVPLIFFFDVGPKDSEILRIIPLRDTLFIMKQDAIYRLAGEGVGAFTVTLMDSFLFLTAPDTAQVLNNQIYMLTTQGIVTVTETAVEIIN